MSDYFDEMGWQPVEAERTNEHQMLLVARFFMENGIFFDEFDSESLAPPAAVDVVRNLPEKLCSAADERCAICLKPNTNADDEVPAVGQEKSDVVDDGSVSGGGGSSFKVLPCTHAFHATCILPWLEKVFIGFFFIFDLFNILFSSTQTNSCPLCRHELPTDDPAYEERKRHRQRASQREEEMETLHNSMFG